MPVQFSLNLIDSNRTFASYQYIFMRTDMVTSIRIQIGANCQLSVMQFSAFRWFVS